jgi:hypothetical protein
MPQKSLLAAAKLVTLFVRNRQLLVFQGDTVPEVFDKLETFSPAKFEERRKFTIHW